MLELIQNISNMNVSVDGIKTMSKIDTILYEVSMYVTGLEQLTKLIAVLEKQPYVDRCERMMR